MRYKHIFILYFIKYSIGCSTDDVVNFFKMHPFLKYYKNIDKEIFMLIQSGLCIGVSTQTQDHPYNYSDIIITIKGLEAIYWIKCIPIIKEIIQIIKIIIPS